MKTGIQGLGWFLRRSEDPIKLGAFYEQNLGLPRLRSWDTSDSSGVMLWAGHTAVLETNRLAQDAALRHSTSQCIPVFRSPNLPAAERALAAAGTHPAEEESDERASTLLFPDPDGNLFGIEQLRAATGNRIDGAWRSGTLPGDIRMGQTVEGLSRVIHKATDVAAEAAFLRRLGLEDLETTSAASRLCLGDNCILDLRPDGETFAPISERSEVPDSWILRVYGIESLRRELTKLGKRCLSQHEFPGGSLDYVLTPDHRLMGWQERKPYNPDVMTTQLIEDLQARSLWVRTEQDSG